MPTLKDRIDNILTDCESIDHYGEVSFSSIEALNRIIDEIDKEQKILRPILKWFAGEMEEDLRKNDFKGGWLDGELGYYQGKASKHLIELKDIDSIKFKTIFHKKKAIDHCVKAANYMMMLAHNLIEELGKQLGVKLEISEKETEEKE